MNLWDWIQAAFQLGRAYPRIELLVAAAGLLLAVTPRLRVVRSRTASTAVHVAAILVLGGIAMAVHYRRVQALLASAMSEEMRAQVERIYSRERWAHLLFAALLSLVVASPLAVEKLRRVREPRG